MLHFLCAAPASSATCQSDSISLNLAVWHTIIPSEFENPLTLATFTSIKEQFYTKSPPGILYVDKITMNKLPAQRENFSDNCLFIIENLQTLTNFTSGKHRFSTRSPPGILCVDKIPISKPRNSLISVNANRVLVEGNRHFHEDRPPRSFPSHKENL